MNIKLWYTWRVVSVLIHLIAVGCYGFALLFQLSHPKGYYWQTNDNELALTNTTLLPGEYTFGWKLKYLTIWNLIINFIVFLFCLICDCFKSNYMFDEPMKSPSIEWMYKIRDTLFHSLVFPLGTFVFVMFFLLISIKGKLISDQIFHRRNPVFLSHLTHTIIFPLLLSEILITYHKKWVKKLIEIAILMTTVLLYSIWCLYLGLIHDLWPYGILRHMSWILRIIFMIICAVIAIVVYFVGVFIHMYSWPTKRIKQWHTSYDN
ncbi:androgen-dependent TFPI-regulating protein-like [Oppia nitens]|uniref:androgen-dependent TFPI-regulating protein-like n=1 Tax=Oppia nitens TaxID=1686743 RepID=UPI0023DBDAC7|nr:androgen-dependent TFPI-regulating protein-like [Oppia nitens]